MKLLMIVLIAATTACIQAQGILIFNHLIVVIQKNFEGGVKQIEQMH